MKKVSGVMWFLLVVWVIYAYFNLTSPIGDNAFELTSVQLFLIRLTIVAPYLLIWAAALHGANKLSDYASSIHDSHDGKALVHFARGLHVLLAGMIASTLLSTFTSRWPEFASTIHRPLQITLNYLYVMFPLAAYALFMLGVREFRQVAPKMRALTKPILPILVIVTMAAAIFVIGVFTNDEREFSLEGQATYYLSDMNLVLTIVLPTIASWLLALYVAVNVWSYQIEVKGTIYKKSLKKLSLGLIGVVVASIVLQFLISLGSIRLIGLGLELILVWIYVWLIALAIGYVLVAVGARRLARIEEVEVGKVNGKEKS